jgi:SAM-dependent methyltransferase
MSEYKNKNLCDVCFSSKFTKLYNETYNGYKYLYGICDNCCHVTQMSLYNKQHYLTLPCSFPYDYEEHSKRRASYIYEFSQEHLKLRENKILDIGCGRGGILEELSKKMLTNNIKGITPEDNYGKEYIIKDDLMNAVDKLRNKYDFILMSHVLEHFLNPIEALRIITGLLEPDGLLYIEVPSFFTGKVRTPKIFTPEHISYFHKHSITNILNICGYEIVKFKESNYWGNIKILCKYSGISKRIKKYNSSYFIKKCSIKEKFFPIYRFISKLNLVRVND